jgi:hypothetical protein
MADRLGLQKLLEECLGSKNVYYQAPSSVRMKYPAIRYSRLNIENTFADDNVYAQNHSYEVIIIDKNPDSVVVDRVSKIPSSHYQRHYTADGLNHDVFTIYY